MAKKRKAKRVRTEKKVPQSYERQYIDQMKKHEDPFADKTGQVRKDNTITL